MTRTRITAAGIAAVAERCRADGWGWRLLCTLAGEAEAVALVGGKPLSAAGTDRWRGPCRHEGHVVQQCTATCGREWKHVRACLYEGHDVDLCTRGTSRIQSCKACPNYSLPEG